MHPSNLKAGNYLSGVMGSRCAQAHVILAVIQGMTNPKMIGSKTRQINGRNTFTQLEKGREISSIELRCGGPYGPIIVELSATHYKGNTTGVHGNDEIYTGKRFAFSFLLIIEKPTLQS